MIALAVVVCGAGAAGVSFHQAPVYESSTRLLVVPMAGDAPGSTEPKLRAVTYAQYATTGPTVSAAIEAARAQGKGVSIKADADGVSPFLIITATASTPSAAQAVAAVYVNQLPQ